MGLLRDPIKAIQNVKRDTEGWTLHLDEPGWLWILRSNV